MLILILGLVLFLGVHSIRIVAEDGRDRLVRRLGEGGYKGLYSLVSLVGLVLLIYGYGWARREGGLVYEPPVGARHLALLIVPLSLVLVAAAYTPPGYIKAAVKHPMVLGVALWSLAHLIANGTAADVVLFGGFLAWAAIDYLAALKRGRREKTTRSSPRWSGDAVAVAIGAAATAVLLAGLHAAAFGVSPLV